MSEHEFQLVDGAGLPAPCAGLVLDKELDRWVCPKCRSQSGDTWQQCRQECPLPISRYYSAPVDVDELSIKEDDLIQPDGITVVPFPKELSLHVKIWVCGKALGKPDGLDWELAGIFTTEAEARSSLRNG